jgi:muconolactone delta-isomerase
MAVLGKLGQITKNALDSGKVKDWGIFAGGWAGYSIIDESATETLTRAMQFMPYIKLKVNPLVGINEVIQIMQSMSK